MVRRYPYYKNEDKISDINKPKSKKKTSGFMNVFGSIVLPIILGILLASMARCVLHSDSPTTQPNPPAQTNKL